MKAVGYIRVSTQKQAEKGYSLEFQRDEIEKTAKYKDLQLVEWYIDKAVSGEKFERPQLQRLLKDAENERFDYVIFYDLSRIARSLKDFLTIRDQLEKEKVGLISTKTSAIDDTTPHGKLQRNILAAFAEFENAIRRERAREGRATKAKSGKFPVGKVKYGYKRDKDGYLQIDPVAHKAVRLMVDMLVNEGRSLVEVVKELDKKGFKTPRGRKGWNVSSVYMILLSPNVIGKFMFNDIEISAPPLISVKEQEQIMKRFQRSKRKFRRQYSPEVEAWFLPGTLKCARCGGPIHANLKKNKNGSYWRSYMCSGRRPKGDRSGRNCDLPAIPASKLENSVWQKISEYLSSKKCLKQFRVMQKQMKALSKKNEEEVNRYTERILQLNKEKEKLFELYSREFITADDIDKRIGKIEQEKAELQELQEKALFAIREKQLSIDKVEEVKDRLKNANLEEKKLIIREIVGKISVTINDEGELAWFMTGTAAFPTFLLKHRDNLTGNGEVV